MGDRNRALLIYCLLGGTSYLKNKDEEDKEKEKEDKYTLRIWSRSKIHLSFHLASSRENPAISSSIFSKA